MTKQRHQRPPLERDKPLRNFSGLFGGAGGAPGRRASPDDAAHADPGPTEAVSSAVNLGYRVIDAYLRQGQEAAKAFAGQELPGQPLLDESLQQMTQRMLQYGMDFAGMWFEIWTKLGQGGFGDAAWPGFAPPSERNRAPRTPPAPAPAPAREHVSVFVQSARPTETSLDLRYPLSNELVVHALRAEGHDAPSISQVSLQRGADDETLSVRVTVPADQPPGPYNAMIVDALTNLPRGTLSVRVL